MERPLTKNIRPNEAPLSLEEYEKAGGYQAVRKALKTMTPQEVVAVVKESNLAAAGRGVSYRYEVGGNAVGRRSPWYQILHN